MSGDYAGLLSLLPPLAVVLRQATPLALAALGGVFSERAGVVNIALEGMMLIGAFTGMWVGQAAGAGVGLLAAVGVGGLLGLLHLVLTQRLRMNHIISGVAINILAVNGTTFLLRRVFNQAEPPREARLSTTLPTTWFVVAAILLPIATHFLFYRTALGLRLRAVGENPESARMAGVNPARLRLVGVLLSGMLAAAAGAYLSVAEFGRFSADMMSSRGFIALAAVICGRWTPLGAALAALAFGFFDALQIRLQGTVKLPPELLLSLPYVLTIVAAFWLRSRPPAALGTSDA
jgi:general nucleoside transport system permease protein